MSFCYNHICRNSKYFCLSFWDLMALDIWLKICLFVQTSFDYTILQIIGIHCFSFFDKLKQNWKWRFCKILKICKALQDFATFCKMLQEPSRFYKILQDSSRSCNILQDSARFWVEVILSLHVFELENIFSEDKHHRSNFPTTVQSAWVLGRPKESKESQMNLKETKGIQRIQKGF